MLLFYYLNNYFVQTKKCINTRNKVNPADLVRLAGEISSSKHSFKIVSQKFKSVFVMHFTTLRINKSLCIHAFLKHLCIREYERFNCLSPFYSSLLRYSWKFGLTSVSAFILWWGATHKSDHWMVASLPPFIFSKFSLLSMQKLPPQY